MLVKTVRVTNPRNTLVQIPSFIVATWGLNLEDKLEVLYDDRTSTVTIRPTKAMQNMQEAVADQ